MTLSKANQTAPAAPIMASNTVNSITLTAIENGEYKKGTDGEWQTSQTFTGLEMNTEYTFYQRLKEDGNHNASPDSQPATIKTSNHAHNWGYQANGATIMATYANTDNVHIGDLTAQITVVKPEKTTYGDSYNANATINGNIDGVTNPDIVYKKGSDTLDAAPTDAGTYTASITLDGATASVEYTIEPKEGDSLAADQKSGETLTYDGTVKTPTLEVKDGTTEVTSYTVKYLGVAPTDYAASETAPTNAGSYKAVITLNGNYSGTMEVSFNIAKQNEPLLTDAQKPTAKENLTYTGDPQELVPTLTSLPEGYTGVQYNTDGGNTWQDEIPTGVESGDYEIMIRYIPDANHEEIVMKVKTTIARTMEMQVDLFVLQYNGTRGLPKEVDNLTLKPEIHVKSGEIESVSKGLEFELKQDMENKVSYENVEFTGKVTDPVPGKYEVKVEGLPLVVFEQGVNYSTDAVINGPIKWKYALSTQAETNEKNGKIVVTVYLIFDDGNRPDEIAVYALPEDEIGAYAILQDGTKEYLLFHTYNICMAYLGSDELCRGYERCFHKDR